MMTTAAAIVAPVGASTDPPLQSWTAGAVLGLRPPRRRPWRARSRGRAPIVYSCLLAIMILGRGGRSEATGPARSRTGAWSGVLKRHSVERTAMREDRGGGQSRAPPAFDETPLPAENDRDHDRILRLQSGLGDIVHNVTLGRLKVGVRVIEARTGRVFFGRGATALMDPASNQKVLATTTALVRLGGDWRFQTEVYGPAPDSRGVIHGDLFLRGSGDPTLSTPDLDELASKLMARGIVRIEGAVISDPRRIGDDRAVPEIEEQPSLMMNRGFVAVRVRPGISGEPPSVMLSPPPPSDDRGAPIDVAVANLARTHDGRRGRLAVQVNAADGGILQIAVAGRIASGSPGIIFHRRVPQMALATAIFFRSALIRTGILVRDHATIGTMASRTELLVAHTSAPLAVLLRKINKDSDNYEADWLLAAVGAEVLGGTATTEKGATVLRQVIGEFGLNPLSYLPKNGSGLGYANRITAHAMTDLLRALYLDPRVGPELLQSLSVGGIDGTTRNRFRDVLVARRVRAKTGTLNGKSCLAGLVGDGDDVVAFSIMVEGFKSRGSLGAVRDAQVAAVKTMMRYVRERGGARVDMPPRFDLAPAGADFETGGEMETEEPEVPPRPVVLARTAASAHHSVYVSSVPGPIHEQPDVTAVVSVDARTPVEPDLNQVAESPPPTSPPSSPSSWSSSSPWSSSWSPSSWSRWPRLGLGGIGSLAGGDAAPGLGVFADWGVAGAGPGLELGLHGTAFRSMDGPGSGVTDWTRFAGALGPRYQIARGSLTVSAHAQLAAGWFWVQGRNYGANSNSRTWAMGVGSGVRVTWDRGTLSPWLGMDAMGWLGNQVIEVAGTAETRSIPALDLSLSIGASFQLR
jgi:PBP4 family serine-type D-alanyl-D-alanine carboxypeptidase